MKTKILALGFFAALLFISCSKDDNKQTTAAFSSDEAKVNSKIDLANDDVSDIVEGQFDETQNSAAGRYSEASSSSNLPICANVVRIPAFGTTLTPGTEVTKTITFGNETTGCTLANGNVLKGTIIVTFTYQPNETTHTINYQFVDFYHNQIKLNGNRFFTRTMTEATEQNPSHPKVVMNMQMTAEFPDGRIFTRVGTRTREIIAGYSTPNTLLDNVYQVTGNWTTTFPNTTIQTSEITTPLLVKMSCREVNKPLLVQGVITFERNGNSATLDYGTGECDNLAVFTINGNSYNIVIGN
jgi:hypothetical protein